MVQRCRIRGKKDRPNCRKVGEEVWNERYCCWDEEKKVFESDGVWTIRNSWGSDWGEGGFVRARISEGDGWCGMNLESHYVIPNMPTVNYPADE